MASNIYWSVLASNIHVQFCNAPVNVKPQGGVGGRATHRILTQTAFPWDGILTLEYCPWVGNLVLRHVSYRKIFPRGGGI